MAYRADVDAGPGRTDAGRLPQSQRHPVFRGWARASRRRHLATAAPRSKRRPRWPWRGRGRSMPPQGCSARQRGGTGLLTRVFRVHGSGDPCHIIFCGQRRYPRAQRRRRFASPQPRPPHAEKHRRYQRGAFGRVVDDDRHEAGRPAGQEPRVFGGEVPCEAEATFAAALGVLREVRQEQRARANRLFDRRVPDGARCAARFRRIRFRGLGRRASRRGAARRPCRRASR